MSKMKLELLLQSVDKASPGIKKLAAAVERSNKRVTQATEQRGKAEEKAARRGMTAARRAATARQRLGVRSEHQVRREIQKTQAAYNRLARSGKSSAEEINRAYANMTQRVQRLNTELGRVSRSQKLVGRAKMTGAVVGGIAAGATAGAMMMAEPARRQRSYDRTVREVANTAFSDRDIDGRRAGVDEIKTLISSVATNIGGDKDAILAAYEKLVGSGEVSHEQAKAVLPAAQKAALATGEELLDFAKAGISAMGNLDVAAKSLPQFYDEVIAIGQSGNFEAKDIAKWAPQIFSAHAELGSKGLKGAREAMTNLQGVRTVSGSSDEAANYYKNYLAKLTSPELAGRMKKIGIDWEGSMKKRVANGQSTLEAAKGIFQHIINASPEYQRLKKQADTATGAEKIEKVEALKKLVGRMEISKVLTDMQAMSGLVGQLSGADSIKAAREAADNAAGSVDTGYQLVAESDDFKIEQGKNAFEEGQNSLMQGFNSFLGDASKLFSDWAKENPTANKVVSGGATAASAVAASGAGYAVSKKLLTRGAATTAQTASASTAAAGAGGAVAAGGKSGIFSRLAAGTGNLFKAALSKANLASLAILPTSTASQEHENALLADARNRHQKRIVSDPAYAQSQAALKSKYANLRKNNENARAALSFSANAKAFNPAIANAKASGNSAMMAKLKQLQATQQTLASNHLSQITPDKDGKLTVQNPELNAQLQTLAAELNQRTDATNTAIQAIAAQPIVIQQTNQVHIDGAVVSETVSRHQGNRLSRGEN